VDQFESRINSTWRVTNRKSFAGMMIHESHARFHHLQFSEQNVFKLGFASLVLFRVLLWIAFSESNDRSMKSHELTRTRNCSNPYKTFTRQNPKHGKPNVPEEPTTYSSAVDNPHYQSDHWKLLSVHSRLFPTFRSH